MARKKRLILKKGDRQKLERMTRSGDFKARKLNRCRILLLASQGKKKKEIAEIINVVYQTVSAICERYKEGGLDNALMEKARSGAPSKFTGKQKAKITALACSAAPAGHCKWSVRLLAEQAVELTIVDEISHDTVATILKKMS
jgi:putative transposase